MAAKKWRAHLQNGWGNQRMPWNDQSGGGSSGGGQGPWGSGPRKPWGQPPRQPPGGQGPDLDEMLRRFRERMRMGGGSGRDGGARGGRPFPWQILAAVLVGGWILSGIYTVDEGERVVVTRLGDYHRTTGPGIHWRLPAPIEASQKVNVTGQRTDEIGFTTVNRQTRDNPDESLMITGDRNNIKDVEDFVFNVRNPVNNTSTGEAGAVRQVAESAMREVIGQRNLEQIITTDRAAVEQSVEQLTQATLDDYRAGVLVLQVELLRAAAPSAVIEAFNDVVNAGQDAETLTNNAQRDTARIVSEAEAYREQVVREATGEAERFMAIHAQYRQAPQVTRDRLYLETMERVYQRGNLIILDQRGGAVPYLPLDGMVRRTPQTQEGTR
jgi:modulator of FtsH protease HflK